jgi:hypothetical protein
MALWEENTNEMLAAAEAERAESMRRQAEYNAMVAEKSAEEAEMLAARNVRQANMTPRQKLLNNITRRSNFPLPGLRGKNLGKLNSRMPNASNRARKMQQTKLRGLNMRATQRALEAAEQANLNRAAAGSKITNAAQRYLTKKSLRERAMRPPGTEGPENTGGELYKLFASKWAARPKTRRGRKNRKSRRRN